MTVLLRSNQLDWALEKIKMGEPIGLPTETVYGLAAVAFDENALAKIFKIKNRPHFDPLIVHVLKKSDVENLTTEILPLQKKLIEAFWPGPLTILFKKSSHIPDLCTSGSPWVAIRSPSHPVFREILKLLKMPLAAPSANRFGRISPTSALQVIEELGPYGLEAVVDGGSCERGIESTVLHVVSDSQIEVLRPGAISIENIAQCVGSQVNVEVVSSNKEGTAVAPGQLASHYAPRTPLVFVENFSEFESWKSKDLSKMALLQVFPDSNWSSLLWNSKIVLSINNSDTEAATKLFSALRELDGSGVEKIVAIKSDDKGLGIAINDRLRRASAKR